MLHEMRQLTDAELDAIAAGSQQGQNGTGLVVVGAQIGDISVTAVDILSHNAVLNNSLNGVTVQAPSTLGQCGSAAASLHQNRRLAPCCFRGRYPLLSSCSPIFSQGGSSRLSHSDDRYR